MNVSSTNFQSNVKNNNLCFGNKKEIPPKTNKKETDVALPEAGTLAAMAGIKSLSSKDETVKVNPDIKQSILFATSRISDFDGFDMASYIDNNPKTVVALSEAKEKDGRYMFNAEDMAVILVNCKDIIDKHPDGVSKVLSEPENINKLSEARNKFVRMWRIMGSTFD